MDVDGVHFEVYIGYVATRKKTSSKSKPSYHHGDLRHALIEASLALISEEGFSALTLREVARRAGVTHAAPTGTSPTRRPCWPPSPRRASAP